MPVSQELKDRVNAKIIECTEKILGKERASRFSFPVTYRTDLKRVAGFAYFEELRIELNEQLLLNNIETFFVTTIPHEVAHLLQAILYPAAKQVHGPEWRSIMTYLGSPISRTHSYDTSVCTAGERFRYVCNCENKTFKVTKILHNKMQKGQKRYCDTCTGRAVYWPTGD